MEKNIPFCIWFTGLSGAGKTTLAKTLKNSFDKMNKPSVLIDGDILRKGMNKNLGFSEADRKENIRRVAEMARIILNSNVMVICAFISPTSELRELAKQIIGEKYFLEVFVDTPLDICMNRDPKGLYKKALRGEIKNFTGLDAIYEQPVSPALTIETRNLGTEHCISLILDSLKIKSFVKITN